MDSFVFTRHTSDCKYKRDRLYRRCNCPKWVEGRFNRVRIRKSASTRLWDEAERFREKLEETLTKGLPLSALRSNPISPEATPIAPVSQTVPVQPLPAEAPGAGDVPSGLPPAWSQPERSPRSLVYPAGRQKERVTVQKAVDAYMTDARSRGLQPDTIKKLERIFEKQFLPWTKAEGLPC
jgi:hypothetical protein